MSLLLHFVIMPLRDHDLTHFVVAKTWNMISCLWLVDWQIVGQLNKSTKHTSWWVEGICTISWLMQHIRSSQLTIPTSKCGDSGIHRESESWPKSTKPSKAPRIIFLKSWIFQNPKKNFKRFFRNPRFKKNNSGTFRRYCIKWLLNRCKKLLCIWINV